MKKIIKNFQIRFSNLQKNEQKSLQYKLNNINKNIVQLKGVPDNWNEVHLRKYFDPQQKKIDEIFIQKTLTGLQKNNAIFFFQDSKMAEEFIDKYHNDWINTPEIQERVLCQLYQPKTKETKLNVIHDEKQIEIYNLPFEATNLDILNLVPELNIEQFQMPMRNQNKNKGYCLVTFLTKDQADIFIRKVQGMHLYGREIKIKQKHFRFATQKKRYQNKSDFILSQAETQEIQINGSLYRHGIKLFNQLCNITVIKFLIFQAKVVQIFIVLSKSDEIKFILNLIQNFSLKFLRFKLVVSLTSFIQPTNQSYEFIINFKSIELGNVHELSSSIQNLFSIQESNQLKAYQLSNKNFVQIISQNYVPYKDCNQHLFNNLLIYSQLNQQQIVKFLFISNSIKSSYESEFQHIYELDIITNSALEFLTSICLNN